MQKLGRIGFLVVYSLAFSQPQNLTELRLQDVRGGIVEFAKLKGKAVVVNIWATWCGPCRSEIPGFVSVYKKYHEKGVEIIGISLDQGDREEVSSFVSEHNITYPVVFPNAAVERVFGEISAIPTTFIINREGNVVDRHIGYLSAKDLEQLIKKVL